MSSHESPGAIILLMWGLMPYRFTYWISSCFSSLSASSGYVVLFVRKWVHSWNSILVLWVNSLERIELLLLPIYKTLLPRALPTSYTPDERIGKPSMTGCVNRSHLFLIGISPSFRTASLQPCYNIIVAAGGLEPPRQMTASSCQDYRACRLHHAASFENQVRGDSLPAQPLTESPCKKRYHNYGCLSIGKNNHLSINNHYKCNLGGL